MSIKVQPSPSHSLCATCREAHAVEYADGRRLVACCAHGMEPLLLAGDVARCSAYDDRRLPAKWEMEKVAWTVRTDTSGKAIGFTPPKAEKD